MLLYRYRGADPQHRDNVGLRQAMQEHVPLVYLHGVVKGAYLAAWPVFIVGDDPTKLTFTVEVDAARLESLEQAASRTPEAQRSYATVLTLQRLHQSSFRERVLRAYRESCAVCKLKHPELLEASHILPDGHPRGVPEVFNGLALCKLHHAAFDENIIGIRPDLVIEVRPDILVETDGPMLLHGIQEFHQARLAVPKPIGQRPKTEFLAERFALFKKLVKRKRLEPAGAFFSGRQDGSVFCQTP